MIRFLLKHGVYRKGKFVSSYYIKSFPGEELHRVFRVLVCDQRLVLTSTQCKIS